MKRTSFGRMQCPVARSLERIGEWWSILIIRDALYGLTRFDQFEESLGIAPNMLARRLSALVDAGLLEKRRYSEHPPRHEYLLTQRGRDFQQVIVAMQAWGNRHFAPEGTSVVMVDSATGATADPVLVDRHTGRPLTGPEFIVAPGPAASERMRRKIASSTWGRAPAQAPSGAQVPRAAPVTRRKGPGSGKTPGSRKTPGAGARS